MPRRELGAEYALTLSDGVQTRLLKVSVDHYLNQFVEAYPRLPSKHFPRFGGIGPESINLGRT